MNFDISSAVSQNYRIDLQIYLRQYLLFNNFVNATINLIWNIWNRHFLLINDIEHFQITIETKDISKLKINFQKY